MARGSVGRSIAVAFVITTVLVSAHAAAPATDARAARASAAAPDPRRCDGNPDTVVMCVKLASPYRFIGDGAGIFSGPRAGRTFTGGYAWISDRVATTDWNVSCDAKLGGKLEWVNAGLGFAGGARLQPIIRRRDTTVKVGGTSYVTLVTCSWRLPLGSTGKLLSLLHPPVDLDDCDVDCKPWGLHFQAPGGAKECNQTTWRVRGHDASIGPEIETALKC